MSRTRYLVALVRGPDARALVQRRINEFLPQIPDLRIVLDAGEWLVFASGPPPIAVGGQGVLLGSFFIRGRAEPVPGLSPEIEAAVISSRGAWLIEAGWGPYICVLATPSRNNIEIVRGPFGDLPCYVAQSEDGLLAASDVSLLLAAGLARPRFDPTAVARHLAAPDIHRSETCLSGVSALRGGERLSASAGALTRDVLWSPWALTGPEKRLLDHDEAARRIRDSARHCVAARSGLRSHILLKLSGGLDSSIVAACLAAAGRPCTALTLATDDKAADERGYARLAANSISIPLVERYRDVGSVAPRRSAAARLPRPSARSFAQDSARIAGEVALEVGADVVFDGGGGDNIFCSLQSVRPATDCLSAPDGRGAFLTTAAAIAELAQVSLLAVAGRAWLASWRRSPAYRWPLDLRFLAAPARDAARGASAHPWLDPPAGALPGTAAHVALITGAQSVVEGFDAEEPLSTCSPLISQPLIEACLRVPSWLWYEDGQNRAIARRAFAGLLPEGTIRRRSKGAPDSFVADIYDANRLVVRDLLLGGVLCQQGLLDIGALAAFLADGGPVRGHDYLRVMQLADAEAWARCWSE
ncbi:MAG TPA: asparagine synthase-related protein [Allosphingosinicella sp.]